MAKKEDGADLEGPHTPPADKQSFLPTPLPSGQTFAPHTDPKPEPDTEEDEDTQTAADELEVPPEVATPVARPLSHPQTPTGPDLEQEVLLRSWKPLSEEEIAQGGDPVVASLRTANDTIAALTELLAKTRIQKSHFQLQNKLLTIETHEAAQRYEVENNIAKREVDRLRLAEHEGESPRQLLGEYNKSSTKVLESYKRKLRRAKLRLEDAVFDIEWRDREIQRLRARLEPATPQSQGIIQHQQPFQTPQHHSHSVQSSPIQPYFPSQQLPPQQHQQSQHQQQQQQQQQHHPMSPVGLVHKGMGHRRTQSAYENRQMDMRHPQQQQQQQQGNSHRLDALGLLASQALHEHNRRSPTELMSPVAFKTQSQNQSQGQSQAPPRQLQPPPAHIMPGPHSGAAPVAPSSPLRESRATELPPSSPEKRRRGSSASTISATSDDDHDNMDSQLRTTPGTPSPVRSKVSPKKRLAQERELARGGVNRVLDFSPGKS